MHDGARPHAQDEAYCKPAGAVPSRLMMARTRKCGAPQRSRRTRARLRAMSCAPRTPAQHRISSSNREQPINQCGSTECSQRYSTGTCFLLSRSVGTAAGRAGPGILRRQNGAWRAATLVAVGPAPHDGRPPSSCTPSLMLCSSPWHVLACTSLCAVRMMGRPADECPDDAPPSLLGSALASARAFCLSAGTDDHLVVHCTDCLYRRPPSKLPRAPRQ